MADSNYLDPVIARRTKKRKLRELTENDRAAILRASLVDFEPQQDIAKRYRVTSSLVSRLVKENQQQPHYEKKRQLKLLKKELERDVVKLTAKSLVESGTVIETAE